MKIERVVKHFIRLKGQGQGEPQGVEEGAAHPVAPAQPKKGGCNILFSFDY